MFSFFLNLCVYARRPYGIREFGLIPGILLLTLAAVLAYFSIDLILISCDHLPDDKKLHPSLGLLSEATGGKTLSKITQIILLIQFIGCVVGYLVAAGGLIDLVWVVCGGKHHIYIYVVIFLALFVIYPLSLMRDMSSLRHTALLGFCCSSYLATTLIIEYFILCDDPNVRVSNYNKEDIKTTEHDQYSTCFWKPNSMHLYVTEQIFPFSNGAASFFEGFLTSFPLFVFSFACHQNVLPVYVELHNRSRKRMHKVLKRSLGWALSVYIIASGAAYLTFLGGTCSNILLNNFKKSAQVGIAAVAISISVTMTSPLLAFAFRFNFSMMVFNTKQIANNIIHHVVTFGFVLISFVIALTITDIATVKHIPYVQYI